MTKGILHLFLEYSDLLSIDNYKIPFSKTRHTANYDTKIAVGKTKTKQCHFHQQFLSVLEFYVSDSFSQKIFPKNIFVMKYM